MIRYHFFYIVLFVCLGQACAVREEASSTSSVRYKTQDFEKNSGCSAGTACASYEVSYPIFLNIDSSAAQALKARIDAAVSMGNPESEGWTMDQIASDFIEGFKAFQTQMADSTAADWYYKAHVEVETFRDSLISLSVNDEWYTGGAHGGGGTYFINFNPLTKKTFTIDQLLKPGYEEFLRAEGEKAFRSIRALPDTASLADQGFQFPDDRFQLNGNYGFITEGIAFVYNNYEVGPYASGPTQIIIPYEKLKDWLR
jgi:hypothetical protein